MQEGEEKISFPQCGNILSIVWKNREKVFHTVEKLVDEAGLEKGIGAENGFGLGETVVGGEDSVKILLDGGGDFEGLYPRGSAEGLGVDGAPESGSLKQIGDGGGVLFLEAADEIGGDADLQSVEARLAAEGIQGVGNEMFAAAGGARGSADFHGDAVEHEGGS